MNITARSWHWSAALIPFALLAQVSAASAEQKTCIEVATVAEVPQEYLNAQGQPATRLVPVARAVPGDEVIWTVTARNVCDQPVDHVVVANAVPEHMSFVANSAMGIGTSIAYSLDGQQFAPLATLAVRADDGSMRSVKADEIRQIRWTYAQTFAPGASAFVRYRATLN
jgi:uncharacterized repeat protein (TIGR01451 family)